jgi:DNA-binding ferritin-like protein (Dps family)
MPALGGFTHTIFYGQKVFLFVSFNKQVKRTLVMQVLFCFALPCKFLGKQLSTLAVVGKDVAGLSASTVSRLKKDWRDEYHA